MIELERLVSELSGTRPVFHSEADFQHALAWAIHTAYPDVDVRLEYRAPYTPDRVHLDLFLKKGDWVGIIELKYKTRKLKVEVNGEHFELQQHGAHPLHRYDVLKDLQRVEEAAAYFPKATGWIVLLTNDEQYWKEHDGGDVSDSAFRIHHDKQLLPGVLSWRDGTESGVGSHRPLPINLKGTYHLDWKDYSQLGIGPGKTLRCLVLKTGLLA